MGRGTARGKLASKVVTAIAGAAARSRAKVPGLGPRPVRTRRGNTHAEADDAAEFERNTEQAIAQSAAQLADREAISSLAPTPEQAHEFAKLLRAGVPHADALCYVLGAVEPGLVDLALPRWLRSRLVVDALAALNGGRWPALEPDARLDIALDKHYAEMAHYLYTHDYESAEGKDMAKLTVAREALERLRTGRLEQNSPFVKFLRTLLQPKSGTPALPDARGDSTRPALMGFVEIEPAIDAEVTETVE